MIIKVKKDVKKVEAMLDLIESRKKSISFLDIKQFSTIVAEMYYEIIKELASSIILLDGFKSVGIQAHKDLVDFLIKYEKISESDIFFINDLRIRRNKSSYEGKNIDLIYLENHEEKINEIIKKLKCLVNNKLKKIKNVT